MEHRRKSQGDCQAEGMIELLREVERSLAVGHCLLGVPEEPAGLRRDHAATDPRVVPRIARSMQAVPLRVIEPQPLLQMWLGRDQLASIEQNSPKGVVSLEQEVRVLDALGQAEELLAGPPLANGRK
jgi:hypothetical protein